MLIAASGLAQKKIIWSPLTITYSKLVNFRDTVCYGSFYEICGDSIRDYNCDYCLPWRIDSISDGKLYRSFPTDNEFVDIIYLQDGKLEKEVCND